MKKEQRQKNGRKRADIQGDTVIKKSNQEHIPFLYRSVKDPFEQREKEKISGNKLYRVIRIK